MVLASLVATRRAELEQKLSNNTRRFDGCWLWTGPTNDRGYGMLWIDSHPVRAHRVAFALAFGDLDDVEKVLHSCDNPPCVRPEHLFLGTQQDNLADARAKGRAYVLGIPKIPPEARAQIRAAYRPGENTHLDLAREFGFPRHLVSKVLRTPRRGRPPRVD